MKRVFLFVLFISFLIFSSCIKPPEYSVIPFISFTSINKTSFVPFDTDSMKLTIYFEDGDGDLGGTETDSLNLFREDSRVPGIFIKSKIPFIDLQGNHKAISGNIYMVIGISQCLTPSVAVDTFHYNIQIQDRAGNLSNIVSTPDVFLTCD